MQTASKQHFEAVFYCALCRADNLTVQVRYGGHTTAIIQQQGYLATANLKAAKRQAKWL